MSINLSSETAERKILSFFFKKPYHLKALYTGEECFAYPKLKRLAKLVHEYVLKYRNPPTKETLSDFANEFAAGNSKLLLECAEAIAEIDLLSESPEEEFGYYYDKLHDCRIGRGIFDAAEFIKEKFQEAKHSDFKSLRKEIINKLMSIKDPEEEVVRGFLHDSAKDRWEKYKERDGGNLGDDIVPFGIKALDDELGGMRKTFLTLLYSKSNGGKTRTALNIGYNNSIAGKNVVIFSLEMEYDLYASCLDSRMAWVDSNHIIFGKLNQEDKKRYFNALKKQYQEKTGIWIVDIPEKATVPRLDEELSIYTASTGLWPDLVIIDYASLMEPMKAYTGRSEKYDFLFGELHQFVRSWKTAGLTLAQESRTATQADKKKKKDEDTDGLDNIGLSNYMAPHCEIVGRLKQSKIDRLQNRMVFRVDKSRYSRANEDIPLFCLFDRNYVGDRLVSGSHVIVKKEVEDDI
ncbi:MAG: DnaB-like helicase C-terminal domain-containing protein [Candidatus Paceibacterota bacterium]